MLKTKRDKENMCLKKNDSLKLIEPIDISSFSNCSDRHKRDSGYGTDCSPASVTTGTRHFTFDSDLEESELHLSNEFQNMDLDNEVFTDDETDVNVADCDETDREVEELLSNSGEFGQPNALYKPSESSTMHTRPPAPVPIPDKGSDERFCDSDEAFTYDLDGNSLFHRCHHSHRQYSCKRYHFRPISRSVGTQTPVSQNRVTDEVRDVHALRPRFQPYKFVRGSSARGLKDKEQNKVLVARDPLPDIVPVPRDRSVSLPVMPGFRHPYELEVGRKLRRISDEFHFVSSNGRLNRISPKQTANFSIGIMGCLSNFRQYFGPSPKY